MSNWRWLMRMRSSDLQLGGGADPDVANVRIVQEQPPFYSREMMPMAWTHVTNAAPGAVTNSGIIISARDAKNIQAKCLVHRVSAITQGNILGGLAAQSSLTFATGPTAATPLFRDVDAELSPLISTFTITTANLPAAGTAGWSHPFAWDTVTAPVANNLYSTAQRSPHAPMWEFIAPDQVLIFIDNTANVSSSWRVCWQAARFS